MFSDFIKRYNNIRAILRDCFLYGCFSRDELENKRKISPRKISYEIRRIQQYVKEEFIKTDRDGRYKLLSLTYDSIRQTNNFLVNTYKTKSFTKIDLILFFKIMIFLHKKNKALSISEIIDNMIDEDILNNDISSKTIERKLIELSDELGLVTYIKEKRSKKYFLSEDILFNLDNNEIKSLLISINLFKNIIAPFTAGYFCEDVLKKYLNYSRHTKYKKLDYFHFRNVHFHPVIEEEILWKLLTAIHKGIIINIIYSVNKKLKTDFVNEFLKPYIIRYDVSHGRYYLVSFNKNNNCIVSRLDRIEDVVYLKENYDRNDLKGTYEWFMKYSWSSVSLNGRVKPEKLEFYIFIDELKENYILEKITNEATNGTISKIENGKYHFEMYINDVYEAIPWIRSFAGYIKILNNPKIEKKLRDDWKEMLISYGIIS